MMAAWYTQYLLLLCKLIPTAWSSMCLQDQWPSIFWVRQDLQSHQMLHHQPWRLRSLAQSLVNNYWWELSARLLHKNAWAIWGCRGQEYIVHNLHCFWQIRMVSARSVTDSTYWTRGLLTPGTSTGTRDSEFVTLTPRFDLESVLSVFSLAALVRIGFTKRYNLVTWYIFRVLVHCSSSVLPQPLSSLVWSRTRTPRA